MAESVTVDAKTGNVRKPTGGADLNLPAGSKCGGVPIGAGGGGAVDSVNGQTGVVVLNAGNVGADAAGAAAAVNTDLETHEADTTNPHAVTKSQVGLGSVTNDAQLKASDLDTDGTLAANSDTKIPSQKAVKTYADQIAAAADAMIFKGVIDCSANPNYPAADSGWTYRVSVAGKIGGGSGINVEVGDLLLCLTDGTASGNQATVGTAWSIAQANIDGAVIGPASAVDNTPMVADGVSGKLIKNVSYATFKTSLALVKADVGLGNVDNTSDANKPVSTAQATAIAVVQTDVTAHEARTDNPHTVTKSQVGLGSVTNDAQLKASDLDTDGTLAANSDTKIPSQKAVKTFANQIIAAADAMVFKGVIDCSGNPNYPAADRGWTYRVSVAGKIGGASGPNVEVADLLLCITDGTVSGNQATVGSAWTIAQANIDGAVVGPASAADGTPMIADGVSGKLIKNVSYSTFKTSLSLVKADVGLSNVDNTADSGKPVSTAQQTAINLQGVPAGGTAGQELQKINSTDYNTQWVTPSGGGSFGTMDNETLARLNLSILR